MAMPFFNMMLRRIRAFGLITKNSNFLRCKLYSSSSTPHIQTVVEPKELSNTEAEVLQHDDYFDLKKLVTLKELFHTKVHLGHKSGCRDPYMVPYIFGSRLELDILDIEQTKVLLQDALNVTAQIVYRGGIILFISRHRQTLHIVEDTAKKCGEYAHCRYWKGGTFTNASTQFGTVTRLPDLCIFINTLNSVFDTHKAVIDSAKLMIPTIGIVDSNCDPRLVSYPIPGNDDTLAAVRYYCRLFKTAVLAGKKKREEDGLDL